MYFQHLKHLLFIDIETVRAQEHFGQLPALWQQLWEKKSQRLGQEPPSQSYQQQAGIFAEFGKVVCICMGMFYQDEDGSLSFRTKTISGDKEASLLTAFCDVLSQLDQQKLSLVAHNGKEFDYPYLCRRMLVNGLPLPDCLQMQGKKPWEIRHLDTLQLWKFGDYKHYTSLELMAATLGIPTPKNDMDGSMVGEVYYREQDLSRIARYCQQDVVTTARIYLKLQGLNDLDQKNIYFK